jgi:hypothetical protein
MGVKLPDDVRNQLAVWAAENVTSLTAEIVASVRDRAKRERRDAQRKAAG